jgi:hypothetical protein
MKKTLIYAFVVRFIPLFILSSMLILHPAQPTCIINGNPLLWSKRFNEVAYPATHNGHSHSESPVQNQSLNIKEQLKQGIRATKLHVYYHNEKNGEYIPYVCHGVGREMINGDYMDKVVDKVPRLFRSWAKDALKQLAPLNELVRDACQVAYGCDTKKGVIPFKHCVLDPSRRSLVNTFEDIKQFLQASPHEVLTLILEDHTQNLEAIAKDFNESGLIKYVHSQEKDKQWPTLGEMVKNNKRLVVLLHGDEKLPYQKYPWLHYVWDYAWDTEWDFQDANHLNDNQKDVMPKRGVQAFKERNNGVKNKLFIVHHFVTELTGGNKNEAKKVNKKGFLKTRLERLAKQASHIPNIVQVDFFEVASNDVLDVINEFNGKK